MITHWFLNSSREGSIILVAKARSGRKEAITDPKAVVKLGGESSEIS